MTNLTLYTICGLVGALAYVVNVSVPAAKRVYQHQRALRQAKRVELVTKRLMGKSDGPNWEYLHEHAWR